MRPPNNVVPIKPYNDPREQPVDAAAVTPTFVQVCSWCPDAAERTAEAQAQGFEVTHGMCDACAERWHAEAEPSVFVRALTGRLPASDICSACGQTRAQHYDHSGCILLGCDYAKTLPSAWPMNPVVYADPYPAVTAAVRKALLADCGPALAAFLSAFAYDDLVGIAHVIGTAAVAAYRREVAK